MSIRHNKTMRRPFLLATVMLNIGWANAAHAQNPSLPFNLHIGGGISVPVSSAGNFADTGKAFQVGIGPNLTRRNSIVGEFMWLGLPENPNTLAPVVNPIVAAGKCGNCFSTNNNLYAFTANYRYQVERRPFGFYVIGGGGWYYRTTELQNYTVLPKTVCEPIWQWYGYSCVSGFVSTNIVPSHAVSSGGVNAGGGLTLSLGNEREYAKFYVEARYHYSPQGGHISTQVVPSPSDFVGEKRVRLGCVNQPLTY